MSAVVMPQQDAYTDAHAIRQRLLSRGESERIVAIIPAYNEEDVIAATIESVLAQSLQPDLIVVAANNCKDRTAEVAKAAGATVFRAEPNKDKKAGALNMTLDVLLDPEPDGTTPLGPDDFVLVVDADTQLSDSFIETARQRFRERAFVGAVGGAFLGRETTSIIGTLQQMEYWRYRNQINRNHERAFVVSGTGALFRIEALMDVKRARQAGELIPAGASHYDTHSLTEDNEMTFALKALGWLCLSPAEMITTTDVMESIPDLWVQRERWYLGALRNIAHYGHRMPWHMKMVYWWQQFMLAMSAVMLVLFVAFWITMALNPSLIGFGSFFWTCMALSLFVQIERSASVWGMGWKPQVLVWTGIDLAYALYLVVIYAYSFGEFLTGKKGGWKAI